MKIWIHINGVQEGPFEMAELPLDRMTPETPVWYEGLEYWVEAGKAPLTADLFRHDNAENVTFDVEDANSSKSYENVEDVDVSVEDNPQGEASRQSGQSSYGYQRFGNGGYQQRSQYAYGNQPSEPCPPTYLVWSILMTVLCCNPFGIVAIIMGARVNSKYRNYDFEGAKRTSETTALWVIMTIVTSLMLAPLSILMML